MMVVPGRPSAGALTFWVFTDEPQAPEVTLSAGNTGAARVSVLPLGKAGDHPFARRLFTVACTGLAADQRYLLTASSNGGPKTAVWSRTLPSALALGKPFTVALGSCYCLPKNQGIDRVYPPRQNSSLDDPIRFRVLGGDQLYMDASEETGTPILVGAPEPYERYTAQWNRFYSSWLQKSPNLCLADDHEFWNDYPHKSTWLTWSESAPGGPLGRRMDRAFSHFQCALNLEAQRAVAAGANLPDSLGTAARNFQLDVAPLSFYFLDTRTERTRYDANPAHFSAAGALQGALGWARSLRGPGVLVIPQPLVQKPASALARAFHTMIDVNLPDYPDDYRALWGGLFAAPYDILVLSGDIHYSRVASVSREPLSHTRVYEAVSSPLALLPPAAEPNRSPSGKIDLVPSARWTNHFAEAPPASYMTLSFQLMSGFVLVTIRVWVVGSTGAELTAERKLPLYRSGQQPI